MPSFDTPVPIVATVDIAAGHLWIGASDRSDTVVEVRPTNESQDGDVRAAEQTRVDYAHGQLVVKAPKSKILSLLGPPASIDVAIYLPSDSRVDVTAWADVRSEGRLGDSTFHAAVGSIRLDQTGRLKLRTAAANVSVGRSVGHTDVKTSSGKIWIGEIDGSAVVKTANGDITVGEVTGDVRLSTANGDIAVERALSTVGAKTAYGSIRIGEVVRGAVTLETGFGELELGVREDTAVWLDVTSQFGSVRSHLDATEGPEPSDETVEVRARTRYGDIVIRRSEPAA